MSIIRPGEARRQPPPAYPAYRSNVLRAWDIRLQDGAETVFFDL